MKQQSNLPATRGEDRSLAGPFDLLQSQIDRVFNDFSRGFGMPSAFWGDGFRMPSSMFGSDGGLMPSIDMHEADGRMMIVADLPGVDEKDIDISVQDDMLTISGEKKSEFEDNDGGRHRTERSFGRFSRSISLPFSVDPNKVDARFANGVLKLSIEKPAEAQQQQKKIPIRH